MAMITDKLYKDANKLEVKEFQRIILHTFLYM